MEEKKFPREVRKPIAQLFNGWDSSFETEEEVARFFQVLESIFTTLGVDIKKAKVLEVGSGDAFLLNYAKKHGMNISGVDADPKGKKGTPQALARIEQLPFPDETFEVVVSIGIIDSKVYKNDPKRMLKQISRVLKPGGFYVATEPLLIKGHLSLANFKLVYPKSPKILQKI